MHGCTHGIACIRATHHTAQQYGSRGSHVHSTQVYGGSASIPQTGPKCVYSREGAETSHVTYLAEHAHKEGPRPWHLVPAGQPGAWGGAMLRADSGLHHHRPGPQVQDVGTCRGHGSRVRNQALAAFKQSEDSVQDVSQAAPPQLTHVRRQLSVLHPKHVDAAMALL